MKNLKMFAIAVMAFAVMAMGVRATSNPNGGYSNATCDPDTTTCYAKIDDHYYATLDLAFTDAKDGDTIELLNNISSSAGLGTISNTLDLFNSGKGLTTKLTINLGKYNLDLTTPTDNTMYVANKGVLTIKGTGELKNKTNAIADIKDGGSLTTEGGLLFTSDSTGAAASLFTVAGKLVIGEGAELVGATTQFIDINDNTADVTLNAKVGKGAAVAVPVVTVERTAAPARNESGAKVTFAGGEYNTTASSIMDVNYGAIVKVEKGNFTSTQRGFIVTDGSLEITGGTIETTLTTVYLNGKSNVVIDGADAKLTSKENTTVETSGGSTTEGTLTIKKGTITSKKAPYSPLYLQSGKVTTKVEGAEFNGPKDTPAIYIKDSLLQGMEDGGEDVFKGMLTGGKYLYMIIGEAKKSDGAPDDYSAEDVAKYLIAEGLEEQTEGNYKVLGNGSGNTPEGEPGTTEPGETGDGNQGPTDNVKNPETNDNILVYAGLGLVSLASVAFTAKKRED